ncbi:MAG: trehalose-phosphatase, partial [Pseudonocardiaceae bacterium]
ATVCVVATVVTRADDLARDEAVEKAIDSLTADPGTSGLFFDFDGVLSNIQADPASVQPLPEITEILGKLAKQFSTTVVLSSRPASFLWERFGGVEQLGLLGLYGLEAADSTGNISVAIEAQPWLEVMPTIRDAAWAMFGSTGVYVEDKHLSVSLHYRADRGQRAEVERWSGYARETWGVKIQPGRLAVELKPDLQVDKGTSLAEVARSRSPVPF